MSAPRRQRGAALLLFLVIAVIAFTTAVFSGYGKWSTPTTSSRNMNAEALAQAKSALIGYVAKEALDFSEDVPGRLPCPEAASVAGTNGEGVAAGNCSTTAASSTVGRLPWRTLGIDKLVDASAEPLWYAVSPNWVLKTGVPPVPPTINPGTTGQLSFDGTPGVVAVIFAPGKPISSNPTAAQIAAGCSALGQARSDRSHVPTSGANPDYRDYLECQNASSPIDTAFGVAAVGNETNAVINDQAVIITDKEILTAIQGPLAERMQRTVAPLLSEFGDQWISTAKFMPYAVPFSPPEANLAASSHCGPSGAAQQSEGLLPIAANTGSCSSRWTGTFSGDGITSNGCDTSSPVNCSFTYYRFNFLGQLVFGLTGVSSTTVTLQATAPHASASFRAKTVQSASDITAPVGTALSNFSIAPKTNGDVGMSVDATVTSANICKDSMPLLGNLCSGLVGLLLGSSSTVSLSFAQLGTPSLAGNKLSTGAKNGHAGPFDLLAPVSGDPHYWFIQNEWYRYTYYAVAPGTSAAQSGGTITVNVFPMDYGANSDKRFVLTLMGPAVTGQTRSPTAALSQYVEGDNATAGASPRVFDYQVFTASGNDRVATCPFTSGTQICD
jgi:hypothetical protein